MEGRTYGIHEILEVLSAVGSVGLRDRADFRDARPAGGHYCCYGRTHSTLHYYQESPEYYEGKVAEGGTRVL